MGFKLGELRKKILTNQSNNVHVGLAITLDYVIHVENLLTQIINRYKEVFHMLPFNRKIYTINQKLRDDEASSPKDIAKEVLGIILAP